MKKTLYPMVVLAAGAFAFSACEDQLDIEQKGVIAVDSFYQTDEDCEKALATAYEYFLIQTFGRTTFGPGIYTPAKVMANHAGDDVNYAGGNYGDHEFGGTVDEFRFKHTPEAIDCLYKGLYSSIYYCNLVLNYFDGKEGATAFMKQAVAEARVLRAFDYFLLACYWGQPPFVSELLSADALPANNEMSQQEYFKWVASECQAAAPNLTTRNGKTDKAGALRVTTGFASALEGKALMFAGDYSGAKTALKKVIDSGNYGLVPGDQFANLFHVEGDCNEEKVFELNMEYSSSVSDWGFGSGLGAYHHSTWMEANCFNWREGNFVKSPIADYNGRVGGWGSIGLPEWYGVAFQENDGDSYRRKATLINIEEAVYLGEEARAIGFKYDDESLNKMTPEQLKTSNKVGISNIDQGLYGQSFWLPLKHICRGTDMTDGGGSHGNNLRLNNIIVMRYAEVLLNYAECCLQTGDAASAKTYVNMIQERAGSKTVSASVDMEVLKREKSFELWFEGCRFQDILRWNDAEGKARLAKAGSAVPHLFDKLYRAPKAEDGEVVWQHGSEANSRFYIVHTHEAKDAGFEVGFKEGVHNLFPYPSTALSQNPNLVQNPGF